MSPETIDVPRQAAGPVPARQPLPSLLLVFALLSPGALFAQPGNIDWLVDGYGTLGAVHSSDGRADYVPDPALLEGAGRTDTVSVLTDSRAAVQVRAQPRGSRFSAVVQVVAEAQSDRSFGADVEWANLQFDWTPALTLRVGRIALGTFMMSDHRKVGYSFPWVRPPAELHQLVSITNSDGVDATWRTTIGDFQYTGQLSYGRNRMTELDGALSAPNLFSFQNQLEHRSLKLHASLLRAKLTFGALQPLWQGYRAFGAAGEQVVRRYDASGDWGRFVGVGIEYDPGPWFAMAEWGRGETDSAFGARYGWYASAGRRFGDVTPYVTFARGGGDFGPDDARGLDPAPYTGDAAAMVAMLNQNLRLIQSGTTPHQQTVSIGARWDVMPWISAKLQYDEVETRNGSIGSFRNSAPGHQPRGADLFSFSVDFLF
ncbi:MAG: hypothetical protein ACQETO_05370 [Pseudomonadota bacterium]